MTVIRIWFRPGEPPKCLAQGTMPRISEGRVVDVDARSMPEALKIIRLAAQESGDAPVTRDFKTLFDWHTREAEVKAARMLIREVSRA